MYDIVVHDVIQLVKEVIVETLIIEKDRPGHIAKHNIIIDDVLEVLIRDYMYFAGRENRWLIIGKTDRNVFLTIVLGEREEENTYGLITARPASRKERSFYIEYTTQGGGEENEDKAS